MTPKMSDRTLTPMGTFDSERYAQLAVSHAEQYKAASPFPHAVIDNFLDGALAEALVGAFPIPEDDNGWVIRDNMNNRRRFQQDETKMPVLLRQMMREFNSRQFILFVEALTGIDNLLSDPYFIGGGLHLSGPGDFLNLHVDFNWHHKLQAHRRVNALLYLNHDWQEEWQGALELWDKDLKQGKSIYPLFNRLVVFNVTEASNHGQPKPNMCPDGEYRRVLNLYYYTTHRDESEMAAPHFTVYKTEGSPFAVELGANYRRSGGAK